MVSMLTKAISYFLLLFSIATLNFANDIDVNFKSISGKKYDNKQTITLQLVLTNNTDQTIKNIKVKSDFLSLLGETDQGTKEPIFTAISVKTKKITSGAILPSNPGTINNNKDLDIDDAELVPNGSLRYRIKLTVNQHVKVPLNLDMKVNNQATNKVAYQRAEYSVEVSKRASPMQYQPGKSITFNVSVKNIGKDDIVNAEVIDTLSSITAEDIDGNSVPAFKSIDDISAKVDGLGSNAGNFTLNQDGLDATDVEIVKNGYVTYAIVATVNPDLYGSFQNIVTFKAHGKDTNSMPIEVPSAQGHLKLSYSVKPSVNYKVSDKLIYTITAKNTGSGYLKNYKIVNEIKNIKSQLANNNDPASNDQTDTSGDPFTSWTLKVNSIDTKSQSALNQSGEQTDVDLNDLVTISPNGEIVYQIKTQTSVVSIGDIESTIQGIDDAGVVKATQNLKVTPLELNTTDISIDKKPISSDYVPEEWVEYDIKVENMDADKFVNNFTLIDKIASCLKAENINGTAESPFSEWKLSVTRFSGDGTAPGLFPYGIPQTGDINITLDLAPAGLVHYKLTAKVKPNIIGAILDNDPCPDDNVPESGSGIEMPEGKPEVIKIVNSKEFIPGDLLAFTILVGNTGRGFLKGLSVTDKISSIQTAMAGGGSASPFTGWTIKKQAINKDGDPSSNSNPDVDGTVKDDQDIITHVHIYPGDVIRYDITATTKVDVIGEIKNEVDTDNGGHSEITTKPKTYDLTVRKSTNKTYYIADDKTIQYKITITNDHDAGFAYQIPVIDDFSKIEAELLHPANKKVPVFTSWDITTQVVGDKADAGLNADWAKVGLNAKASIPAGGSVTYNIKAQLQPVSQDNIVWGSFSNQVQVETDSETLSDSASSYIKIPNIAVAKIVDVPWYKPGEKITYTITVDNLGPGYANNAEVTDDIKALGLFSSWTIQATPIGVGSRIIDGVKDDENINTRVDIAPNGQMIFKVTGTVIDNVDLLNKITNTVKVTDPISGRETDASADVEKYTEDKPSFSITKSSDSVYFVPGKILTYTITATNHADEQSAPLTFYDSFSQNNKATLANSKNGHYDDTEGNAFEEWRYSTDGGNTWSGWKKFLITVSGVRLKPREARSLLIEALIKDNVVEQKIRNTAYLFSTVVPPGLGGGSTKFQFAKASIENIKANPGGGIKVDYDREFYKPGDEITYHITVTSQQGYYNNVNILDEISKMRVMTIDAGLQHPFDNQFSVAVTKTDTHDGGTTDGTLDGVVQDNNDLKTIVDVGPRDEVRFTIKGKVIDNAAGNFTNFTHGAELISHPYENSYSYLKTTLESNYKAGDTLTYKLSVFNTGFSHVTNLPVKDDLKSIQVIDVDGKNIAAFDSWEISHVTQPITANVKTGAKPSYSNYYSVSPYQNNQNLDVTVDLPIGGRIDFTIKAVVNARAMEKIANTAFFGDDSTSVVTNPETSNFSVSKTIDDFLSASSESIKSKEYMPGGHIIYFIRIDNIFGSNVSNVKVTDNIAGIMTDWFDGTKGAAFESWVITSSTDGGAVSNAGSYTDNNNIDTSIDIGVDGFIEYRIDALINEEAVGLIENTVKVGDVTEQSELAKMASSDVTVIKEAYEKADYLNKKSTYFAADKVFYKISLVNSGQGTWYDQQVVDKISKIKTDIGEDATTAGSKPKGPAFSNWSTSAASSNGRVTNFGTFVAATNQDINAKNVAIAANGNIDFFIEADIDYSALGIIRNKVVTAVEDSQAIISPEPYSLDINKKIVSINGVAVVGGSETYKPGDEVIYEITIANTVNTWANDISVVDNISEINTTVIDPTHGKLNNQPAFSTWSVTATVTDGNNTTADTYVPPIPNETNIDVELDIAPLETVTFEIKAQIKVNAIGIIDANTVTVDDQQSHSNNINPIDVADKLVVKKEVVSTDADHDPLHEYAPNGNVTYRVWVENQGEGYALEVKITDPIDEIISTDGKVAFVSYHVELETPAPLHSYISGDFDGDVALNAIAFIAPNERYSFLVSGTVSGAVMGDITNIFHANDKTDSKTLIPGAPKLVAEKTADTRTYVPGQKVTFTIKVTNDSDSGAEFTLADYLTQIQVDTVDGKGSVFAPGSLKNSCVLSETTYSSFSIPVSTYEGDLLTEVFLTAHDKAGVPASITCTMQGEVNPKAIGKFTNSALVDGNATDLPYYILPEASDIVISKSESKSPATYAPREQIGFDINIKNQGKGYATRVIVSDIAKNILSEIAGSHTISPVIPKWAKREVVFVDATGAPSTMSKAIPGKEQPDIYYNEFIIYPGDTVKLHLEGIVDSFAIADITNEVEVTDTTVNPPKKSTDNATYQPEPSLIEIDKIGEPELFRPADEIQYIISVSNKGLGWATHVVIIDDVGSITADFIGNTNKKAFQTNSLKVKTTADPKLVEVKPVINNLFEAIADIAPNSTITFILNAQLRSGVVGDVTNIVSADEKEAFFVIYPHLSHLVRIDKEVNHEVYHIGERLNYTILVENASDFPANNVFVSDLMSIVTTSVADGSSQKCFVDWKTHLENNDGVKVFDVDTGTPFVDLVNKDLKVSMDMPAKTSVKFTIDAGFNPFAVGEVLNTTSLYTPPIMPVVDFAKSIPDAPKFEAKKSGDAVYYKPGEDFSFTIEISNTSENIIFQVPLIDDLNSIQVITDDGATAPAFDPSTTLLEVDSSSLPATSYVTKQSDTTFVVTIGVGDTIRFIASGKVNPNAVGDIQNIAQFDGRDIPSNNVPLVLPELKAVFYTDYKAYVPGEPVTYHFVIKNMGGYIAYNIPVKSMFKSATSDYIEFNTGPAFDKWTLSDSVEGDKTNAGTYQADQDLDTKVIIDVDGKIDYEFVADTDIDLVGKIDVYVEYDDLKKENGKAVKQQQQLSVLNLPPIPSRMNVIKQVEKDKYTEQDKVVRYTLKASNEGKGNLQNVRLIDDLSSLVSRKGQPIFSSWIFDMKENGLSVPANQQPKPNENLDVLWNFKSQQRNEVQIEIEATINSDLDDDVTNIFTSTDQRGNEQSASATAHIKKDSINEGELKLIKQVKQRSVQVGEAVEYEIILENTHEVTTFKDVWVEDQFPAGFRYVKSSARIRYSGDNQSSSIEPVVTDKLLFGPLLPIPPKQKATIRYVLQAGIGITFGQYKNTAIAKDNSRYVSNSDSAVVDVVGDKVFDTAAIIGKVFEDHNGNGYQSDATARKVAVSANIRPDNYINNSMEQKINGKWLPLKEKSSLVINHKIKLGDLKGLSYHVNQQDTIKQLRFKTKTAETFTLFVTSQSGSNIVIDPKGRFVKRQFGDLDKGLSSENIIVTRKLVKQDQDYLWEITLENRGINDDGIPGVKLITAEGFKIETDAYGRFHIPDQWVLDRKGQNFMVKVDVDSLPTGMRVISENPKIQRMTANQLMKFNFSVQHNQSAVIQAKVQ